MILLFHNLKIDPDGTLEFSVLVVLELSIMIFRNIDN
jgi:hypothetical protein